MTTVVSGTAYGTVVLHVAPEAAVGGPLALVRDGDRIRLDVPNRTLDLLVGEDSLGQRGADWVPPPPASLGWQRVFTEHVQQADQGADLGFWTELQDGKQQDEQREGES